MVSVIIPTYNRAELVIRAIKSVSQQTYKDTEIIVVDDGSTDNTVDLISSLNPPIRYITQANTGVAAARNFGLSQAMGEYVAFLDSDDYWLPNKLEKQLSLINNHICVYTNFFFDTNTGLDPKTKFEYEKPQTSFKKPLFVDYVPISISTVLVKTDTLREIGGFNQNMKLNEDILLWHELSQMGEFGFVSEPEAVINIQQNPTIQHLSTSQTSRALHKTEFEKYWQIFQSKYGTNYSRTEMSDFYEKFTKKVEQLTTSAI